MSWIVLGNYILLNLFLAILLDGFSNTDDMEGTGDSLYDPLRLPLDSDEQEVYFLHIQTISSNSNFNLKKQVS